MNVYSYRAFNKQGAILKGTVSALSPHDLFFKLQEKGLEPISCHASLIKKFFLFHKPKHFYEDLISFCLYLRYFLKAGLSLLEALQEMQSVFRGTFRNSIEGFIQEIRQGALFSEALQKQAPFFGPVLITLVAAGEKAGNLEDVLQTMRQILQKQQEIRKRFQKAFRYPLILVCVLGTSFTMLFAYLLPPFIDFFQVCHLEPSWETKVLISLHQNFPFWASVLGSLLFIGFILFVFSKTVYFRFKIHAYLVRIPGVGPLWLKLQLGPFLELLSLILSSKMDLLQSISLAKTSFSSPYLQHKIDFLIEDIRQGHKLSQALRRASLFPSFLVRMVQLGEETGEMHESIKQLSAIYAQETEDKLQFFILAIEPSLLILMGLLMMWMIVGLFLPLYENLPLLQEM